MAWTQQINLKGPKGDTGEAGPAGSQGLQGVQGNPGEPGEDGKSIEFTATVGTYADLPSDLGAGDAGKGYYVEAEGELYPWSGTAFPAQGAGIEVKGPKGDKGEKGDQGDQGPEGQQGNTGATGQDGAPGATGDQGPRGSKWFTGNGVPTTVSGSVAGDMYLDKTTGDVYELSS